MNTVSKLLRLCALAPLLATTAAFAPLQQTDPDQPQIHITQIDTSQFPKVTVYVSVTNAAGEPVGVEPGQIALYENGTSLAFDTVSGSGEIGALTTLLVMDISGSMNNNDKLQAAKDAARAYVDQMRPGDQAGLLAFNTEIQYVQPLTTDRQALKIAIDGLKAQHDTAMYNALVQATEILADVAGRKAIILLADGLDNRSTQTADEVIEQIGPSGLSISTIGLGDPSQLGVSNAALDEKALRSLTERAGGTLGYANDLESLRGLYEQYGRALQSEYVITYLSPSTLRDGVNRSLSVALSGNAEQVTAEYNPGGLVPEVAGRNTWPLFFAILGGLVILLFAPALISRGVEMIGGLRTGKGKTAKKGSKVRLQVEPPSRIRLR
ncbi:MAG TPA: VWA domain-containing protein [Anaerolineales bacterium]|nr:VWA domain-containing protein [Anaerolineales bacterium]